MRVGIDLDGVCYDFAGALAHYLVSHRKAERSRPMPAPTRWEFYEDWGYSLTEFLATCADGVDAGVIFTHGDPLPGVVDGWHAIRAAGHSIHVVTDRRHGSPGASERATLEWLHRHDLPFDSITFTADKTAVRLDVMVDDKPANYDALTAAGVAAYLHTQPWNTHVPDARRVTSLPHFAEVIA